MANSNPSGLNFTFSQLPSRVLFGVGRLNDVRSELLALGKSNALVLATPHQKPLAHQIAMLLDGLCAGVHAEAVQHVPYYTIEAALKIVDERNVDCLVAPGGGSTIGLAKGIALERPLPIIAIPTTYAGSEMTHIWGISKEGRKTTGRDPRIKPTTVIYDPELIMTLPPKMSITSGINAMAHAVEALYAENQNPISSLMAEESIRGLAAGLPVVATDPTNLAARSDTLYGAWLAATVLGQVGMALHHKLCHTLGGSFGMPHAETHTVILPYATAYNAPFAPKAIQAMSRALDCPIDEVAGAIYDISAKNGGPISLKELGFAKNSIEKAAELATQNPYYNPGPVTKDGIVQLLTKAFYGQRPLANSSRQK